MIFGTAILLMVLKPAAAQIFNPDTNCTFKHLVEFPQKLPIESPRWPASYKPGQTCRWTFHCSARYNCRLRCDVKLPYSDSCSEDKLLVSRLGNDQFVGATVYCGRTIINARSLNQKITLGLISKKTSAGGTFKCQIRAESVRYVN